MIGPGAKEKSSSSLDSPGSLGTGAGVEMPSLKHQESSLAMLEVKTYLLGSLIVKFIDPGF